MSFAEHMQEMDWVAEMRCDQGTTDQDVQEHVIEISLFFFKGNIFRILY